MTDETRGAEAIERAAEAIYGVMQADGSGDPQRYPWVPGGNSLRQDEARRYARAGVEALLAERERLTREIETMRTDALYEAARAVCYMCRERGQPTFQEGHGYRHGPLEWCPAHAIYHLLAASSSDGPAAPSDRETRDGK